MKYVAATKSSSSSSSRNKNKNMKFGIAASILAFQATASSSSAVVDEKQKKQSSLVLNNSFNRDVKLLQHHQPSSLRKNKIRSHLRQQKTVGAVAFGSKTVPQQLFNNPKRPNHVKECDPYALDMGILECGGKEGGSTSRYCLKSVQSSKGGICQSTTHPDDAGGDDDDALLLTNRRRRRVQGDETDNEYLYGECDYTNFDNTTQLGTIQCEGISSFCYLDSNVFPCCYSYASTTTFGPEEDYVAKSYTFYFTTPYSQNVTRTSIINGDSGDNTCEVIFNGEACTSCEVLTPTGDEDGYYEEDFCYEFDCTNVPQGMEGNTCDAPGRDEALIPILSQCFDLTSGCNICGPDSYLMFPNTTVGGSQYEVTCNDVYYQILYGESDGSTDCTYFQYYFGNVCCEGTPTPCNICGQDGELQDPDGIVEVPNYRDVTCQELFDGDTPDLIYAEGCPFITYLASPICCEEEEALRLCIICERDEAVSNPDAVIQVPGQPDITCEQLQNFGRIGAIPEELCGPAQVAAPSLCGCGGPTEAPSSMPTGPTASPSPSMMPVPTDEPGTTAPPVDGSSMPAMPVPTDEPGTTGPPVDGSSMPAMPPVDGSNMPAMPSPTDEPGTTGPPVDGSSMPAMPSPTGEPGTTGPPAEASGMPSGLPVMPSPTDEPAPTDSPIGEPTDPPVQEPTDPPVEGPTDPPSESGSSSTFSSSALLCLSLGSIAAYMAL